MITTGIIREIGINKGTFIGNAYKVELNIFQIPGDYNKDNYTYIANCSTINGLYNLYNVGDMVYVGFLNNNKSLPIILGKIYQGLQNESNGYLNLNSLQVVGNINLSDKIQIGDISYKDLKKLLTDVESLTNKIYYQHNITGTGTYNEQTVAITFNIISKLPLFTSDTMDKLIEEILRLYPLTNLIGRDGDNKLYNIFINNSNIQAREINQTSTSILLDSIEDIAIEI